MNKSRLIQTYLPDGTLEGVRIVELLESQVKAFGGSNKGMVWKDAKGRTMDEIMRKTQK